MGRTLPWRSRARTPATAGQLDFRHQRPWLDAERSGQLQDCLDGGGAGRSLDVGDRGAVQAGPSGKGFLRVPAGFAQLADTQTERLDIRVLGHAAKRPAGVTKRLQTIRHQTKRNIQ